MNDLLSFLPTHLSLVKLPQSLAGSQEAGGGGTETRCKHRWQCLPEWLVVRYQIGLPTDASSTKTSAWENLGPAHFKDPPFVPNPSPPLPPSSVKTERSLVRGMSSF